MSKQCCQWFTRQKTVYFKNTDHACATVVQFFIFFDYKQIIYTCAASLHNNTEGIIIIKCVAYILFYRATYIILGSRYNWGGGGEISISQCVPINNHISIYKRLWSITIIHCNFVALVKWNRFLMLFLYTYIYNMKRIMEHGKVMKDEIQIE